MNRGSISNDLIIKIQYVLEVALVSIATTSALMSKTIIDARSALTLGISRLIPKLQMSTDDNPIWL